MSPAVAAAPAKYQLTILTAARCPLRGGEVLGLQSRCSDISVGRATTERDRALANSLAAMAPGPAVMSLVPAAPLTEAIRTKLAEG